MTVGQDGQPGQLGTMVKYDGGLEWSARAAGQDG